MGPKSAFNLLGDYGRDDSNGDQHENNSLVYATTRTES